MELVEEAAFIEPRNDFSFGGDEMMHTSDDNGREEEVDSDEGEVQFTGDEEEDFVTRQEDQQQQRPHGASSSNDMQLSGLREDGIPIVSCDEKGSSPETMSPHATSPRTQLASPSTTTIATPLHCPPEVDLSSSDHRLNYLLDCHDEPRGTFVHFHDDDTRVFDMLYTAFQEAVESKLGQVQNYTKHLLHYNLRAPGFPTTAGMPNREIFASINPDQVLQYEIAMTVKLRQALCEMGYCSSEQNIELHLSFLKTMETEVQPPHIDYQWDAIEPTYFTKTPRSFRGRYKEWVPFIALFPLTFDGMTVEVWHARKDHCHPPAQNQTGAIVTIPFGSILLLRADVVHAGGFQTSYTGNPRAHFYVYKTPGGVQHSYPLANCYELPGSGLPLLQQYRHNPQLTALSNPVLFVRNKDKKGFR
jgi:hypothetical protein